MSDEYRINCIGSSYQVWCGNELVSCCDSISEARNEIDEIKAQKEFEREVANVRIEDLPFF